MTVEQELKIAQLIIEELAQENRELKMRMLFLTAAKVVENESATEAPE